MPAIGFSWPCSIVYTTRGKLLGDSRVGRFDFPTPNRRVLLVPATAVFTAGAVWVSARVSSYRLNAIADLAVLAEVLLRWIASFDRKRWSPSACEGLRAPGC